MSHIRRGLIIIHSSNTSIPIEDISRLSFDELAIATSAAEFSYGTGKLDSELFERVKTWVSTSSLPSDKASSGLSQLPAWVAMGMRARYK